MWVQHMSIQHVGGVLSVPNGVRGTETAADEVRSASKRFRDLEHVSERIGACRTDRTSHTRPYEVARSWGVRGNVL